MDASASVLMMTLATASSFSSPVLDRPAALPAVSMTTIATGRPKSCIILVAACFTIAASILAAFGLRRRGQPCTQANGAFPVPSRFLNGGEPNVDLVVSLAREK